MSELAKYSDDELFAILNANIEEELRSRGYEHGWYKKVHYSGMIYILVNPSFKNLVKIGYADDVTKRLKSLNSNPGLPDPYHVYATYKVKKRLEDLKLHRLIDSLDSNLRHVKNREFYEMTPEKAYEILSAIAEINGDEDLLVLNPMQDNYFSNDVSETVSKPVVSKPVPASSESKPVTINFLDGTSDFRPFLSWKDWTVQTCLKAIEIYGESEFKKIVLDPNMKQFHHKKRDIFSTDEAAMRGFSCCKLVPGLWLLTNFSSNDHIRLVAELVKLFPKAESKLIYV